MNFIFHFKLLFIIILGFIFLPSSQASNTDVLAGQQGYSFLPSSKSSNTDILAGQQIWTIFNPSRAVSDAAQKLYLDGLIDIFHSSREHLKFRLEPSNFDQVRSTLEGQGATIVVEVQDVKTFIDDLERESPSTTSERMDSKTLPERSYMTFEQIEDYLDNLAATNEFVTKTSIGKSIEDRDIWMITIKSTTVDPQKSIFIEGGIHAREWISPAVTLHLVDTLSQNLDLFDGIEIKIVPVTNPDGYVYTHTTDRLWRKNRRDNSGSSCMGVDLNRNFDHEFGTSGTSNNPCSQVYLGTSGFSEPETDSLSKAVLATDNLILYLSLHSYGQLMLYPWGYTAESFPEQDMFHQVAEEFVAAVRAVHRKRYKPMPAAQLYPASGISFDWVYGVLNVPYPFLIELRDTGGRGFELPSRQIPGTRREIWAGFLVLLEKVKEY